MTDTPEFAELVDRVYNMISGDVIEEMVRTGASPEDVIRNLDDRFQSDFFNTPHPRTGLLNQRTGWQSQIDRGDSFGRARISELVAQKLQERETAKLRRSGELEIRTEPITTEAPRDITPPRRAPPPPRQEVSPEVQERIERGKEIRQAYLARERRKKSWSSSLYKDLWG